MKAKGIDEVIVYCVNDAAVMQAWAKDQGIEGSMVTFLADTRGEFTRAVGMVLNHQNVMHALGTLRCKRFALVALNGTVKRVEVSAAEGDPAGDDDPSKSCVENLLANL